MRKQTEALEHEQNGVHSERDSSLGNPDLDYRTYIERKSSEKTHRIRALSIIAISLSIMALIVCGSMIWKDVTSRVSMTTMQESSNELANNQQYEEARDIASREKFKASNIPDYIKNWLAGLFEKSVVDRKEKDNLLKNGITIGRSSKDFLGLDYQDAYEELDNKGFKHIDQSYIISNSSKYKKVNEGTVIGIRINETDQFKAEDKFLPDSIIEILYLKKETATDDGMAVSDAQVKEIIIGRSADDFKQLPYQKAQEQLDKKGFTNIESSYIIDNSNKYKDYNEGEVIRVEVNGEKRFKADDSFPSNAKIVILYLKRDSIPVAETESSDLGITIGRSSKDFKSLTYDEAKDYLIQRGFDENNITVSPFYSKSIRYRKTPVGMTIKIRINGTESFKQMDKFPSDSEIEIYSYTSND